MAIISGLAATNLRGSAGKLTFKMVNGTNVMTEKVASVKNPRSVAQQKQRMTMRTVINAYSVLKEICDHSFEGVRTGALSMAKFMKYNLNALKGQSYSFANYGTEAFAPNEYIVSKGSLNPLVARFSDDNILLNNSLVSGSATPQAICDKLGIEVGDQITIGAVIANGSADDEGEQNLGLLQLCRIIFDLAKSDTVIADGATLSTDNVLSEDSSVGNFLPVWDASSGINFALSINNTVFNETNIIGLFAIASRKSGSTWLRSSQKMYISSEWTDLAAFRSNVVLSTYGVETNLYLNNAES